MAKNEIQELDELPHLNKNSIQKLGKELLARREIRKMDASNVEGYYLYSHPWKSTAVYLTLIKATEAWLRRQFENQV